MNEGADTHLQQPDVAKALIRAAGVAALLVLGCAAIAAVIANAPDATVVKLVVALKFAAMIGTASGVGYLQFRHWAPALGASVAPVPAIGLSLVLLPSQANSYHLFAVFPYLLGFALGLTIADSIVAAVADGAEIPDRTMRPSDLPVVVSSLIAATVPALVLALTGRAGERVVALPAMWSNAAAIILAASAVPLACSFGTYGEDFIARNNRVREDWNRRLDWVGGVVRPRWSSSAVGILVVFVVLAVFGSASLRIAVTSRLTHFGVWAVGFSIFAVAAVTITQAWRRLLAFVVIVLCGLAMMIWGFARLGAALDVRLATIALDLSGLMFIPLAVWSARAARRGTDTGLASARAMFEKGPIALLSTGSSFALLIPWYSELDGARLGTVFALVYTIAAVAIFLPAGANVVDMLVPSRQTVADRYRVK